MTCLWLDTQGLVYSGTIRDFYMARGPGTCRRPIDQGLV